MAKKGLTKEEVYEHLKDFKSEEGKINYLNSVLKKEKLLSPETREAVYETLLDKYISKEKWEDAERVAEKLGEEGQKVLLDGYIRKSLWKSAERVAEKLGEEGQKVLPKILEGYMKYGRWENAERLAEKLGEEGQKALLDGYIRESLWKSAERLAERMGEKNVDPEKLAEIYEYTGKIMKAKSLRKRAKRK